MPDSSDPARPESLRIAVVGLGSIGGVVAACLAAAGRHRVLACTRRKLPVLTLEIAGEAGAQELELDNRSDPEAAGLAADWAPVDWLLLCTKAQDSEAAGPWLRRLCGPGTRVAVLQNGLGHRERVEPLAGGARVLPAIVYFNGERLAGERVRLSKVAARDLVAADDADGRAFAALFEGTPLRVELSADLTTLVWRKLLLNLAANPISALTRRRQEVFRRTDVKELILALLREAVAVGRAEGAALAEDEAERTLDILLGYPPETGTSMYFDALAGRSLEVEAICGALVAAARRHGIATPVNDTLATLLRALHEAPERA